MMYYTSELKSEIMESECLGKSSAALPLGYAEVGVGSAFAIENDMSNLGFESPAACTILVAYHPSCLGIDRVSLVAGVAFYGLVTSLNHIGPDHWRPSPARSFSSVGHAADFSAVP